MDTTGMIKDKVKGGPGYEELFYPPTGKLFAEVK
jgi:hypothetical protein